MHGPPFKTSPPRCPDSYLGGLVHFKLITYCEFSSVHRYRPLFDHTLNFILELVKLELANNQG